MERVLAQLKPKFAKKNPNSKCIPTMHCAHYWRPTHAWSDNGQKGVICCSNVTILTIIRETIANFRKIHKTYWEWIFKSFPTMRWSKKLVEPSRRMIDFDAHFWVNLRFFSIIRKTIANFRKTYNTYWQWIFKSFPTKYRAQKSVEPLRRIARFDAPFPPPTTPTKSHPPLIRLL